MQRELAAHVCQRPAAGAQLSEVRGHRQLALVAVPLVGEVAAHHGDGKSQGQDACGEVVGKEGGREGTCPVRSSCTQGSGSDQADIMW